MWYQQIINGVLAGFLLTFVGTLAVAGAYVRYRAWRAERQRRPKVLCVCELNGMMGVCSRADYDFASRTQWRPFLRGENEYDHGNLVSRAGHRIVVSPTFIFHRGSPEYKALVSRSYLERAVIHMPERHPHETDAHAFERAMRYLYGVKPGR